MTETIISLLSIIVGIVGTVIFARIYTTSFSGITLPTICGVFGSILFIKVFSRLGFSPNHITHSHSKILLLLLNFAVSILGGIAVLKFIFYVKKKYT